MRRAGSVFLVFAAVLAASCGGEKTPAAQGIEIGFFGALTGPQATFALSGKNGARLAVDQMNRAGGVLGKKLDLLVEDDHNEPSEAASAVSKLITRDHVVALIGENASSRSLAAAPIAQNYQVPMVSPSSTNVEVTKKGDYIFRVCFIDSYQGKALATFARQNLQAKTAALLVDAKSDYSVGLAEAFRRAFSTLKGRIVEELKYAEGDSDFSAQLTVLRSSRPDAIFIPGYYTDAGLIARQARSLGIQAALLGADGWDSPKLRSRRGSLLQPLRRRGSFPVGADLRRGLPRDLRRRSGFDRGALLRRGPLDRRRDAPRRLDRKQARPGRPGRDGGLPRRDREDHNGRGPKSRQARRDPQDRGWKVPLRRHHPALGVMRKT